MIFIIFFPFMFPFPCFRFHLQFPSFPRNPLAPIPQVCLELLQVVGLIMVSNVIAKLETFSIANVVESLQKHSVSTLLMSTEILRTIMQ